MERAAAIKQLGKILGKSLGYRVDARAPDADEREQAREDAKKLSEACKNAEKAMTDRRNAILAADSEFQKLTAEWRAIKEAKDKAFSLSMHYKITVGTSNGMFFLVKASGRFMEQVIEKLRTTQH